MPVLFLARLIKLIQEGKEDLAGQRYFGFLAGGALCLSVDNWTVTAVATFTWPRHAGGGRRPR
jgi:hypothetical protein